jgi:hypothetical protein
MSLQHQWVTYFIAEIEIMEKGMKGNSPGKWKVRPHSKSSEQVRSFENTKIHPDLPIANSDTTLSVLDINDITNYKTQPRPNQRHA